MRRAALLSLGSLQTYRKGLDTYNPDKLGLGDFMLQKSGAQPEDNYAGPFATQILRPMEMSVPGAACFPWAMRWSNANDNEKDWIFLADGSTAGNTRKLFHAQFDRKTGVANMVGFVTLTFPGTAEAKTVRGMRMKYIKRTAGTVAVATGTAVTGVGTAFLASFVGSRIGFGSTDPKAITSWYPISAIASDTGLTLGTSAPNFSAGTAYVIEDLSCVMAITSATTTNGGLYMVKGLSVDLFTPTGGAVPAASTTDKIRAVYHLADASTVTNTVALGMGMQDEIDVNTHYVWVIDTIANPVLFKYNINAALTLTTGKATNAFVLKTGSGGAVTGTPSQLNNGRIATVNHGPGLGIPCFYFTTSTRVYRSVNVDTITSLSTSWLTDNMTEVPPGSVNTFAAGSVMSSLEYSSVIDEFIITPNGGASAFFRPYLTKYKTDGSQFDRILFSENKQLDQGTADADALVPNLGNLATSMSAWAEGGILYYCRNGTTAALNQIYIIPLGADWEYASISGGRLILPRISTPNANKYVCAFANEIQVIGGATGKNLGGNPEPYRLYYRTGGISDDTGGWNLINSNGDISGVAGASEIQFMAEFRIANAGTGARLQKVGVVYDDIGTLTNYLNSASKSDAANKRFAWYFKTAFGSAVPELRVRLYDADTDALLVDDNTAAPSGTFERTTDGTSWSTWNNTDRGNSTTYMRYTPASLADNIKVRAVLTLN